MPGNVAYLKLRYLADTKNANETALKTIRSIRQTNALSLDLRDNSGGSGSMVQLLVSIILLKAPTEILRINYWTGNVVTLKTQRMSRRYSYPARPLFILCNEKTFSAAEVFAFIVSNRKRTTLVGNRTAGAGNIAGPYPLTDAFIITIPVGKIVDPLIYTGGEATGVSPTIDSGSKDALILAKSLINHH